DRHHALLQGEHFLGQEIAQTRRQGFHTVMLYVFLNIVGSFRVAGGGCHDVDQYRSNKLVHIASFGNQWFGAGADALEQHASSFRMAPSAINSTPLSKPMVCADNPRRGIDMAGSRSPPTSERRINTKPWRIMFLFIS